MAAPTTEVLGARGQCAVQVEGRNRPPGPLPVAVAAGDQDDGAVVPLDETRSHDADHALVPVLARDDVRAPAALRLGRLVDFGDRGAEDPVLDLLPRAVELVQ